MLKTKKLCWNITKDIRPAGIGTRSRPKSGSSAELETKLAVRFWTPFKYKKYKFKSKILAFSDNKSKVNAHVSPSSYV